MGKSVNTKFLRMLVDIKTLVNKGAIHEGEKPIIYDKRYKVAQYYGEVNGTNREYRITYFDGVPVEIYYSIEGQMSGHLYR